MPLSLEEMTAVAIRNQDVYKRQEYTAEQYNAAKDGLFTTNEKAMLNFLDGTLKVQEGEQVVIGGGVTDDKVTLSGVVPVVAKESEAAGEAGAKIDSVPDRFIQVVAADDANKTLLTASSLEVKDLSLIHI